MKIKREKTNTKLQNVLGLLSIIIKIPKKLSVIYKSNPVGTNAMEKIDLVGTKAITMYMRLNIIQGII